MRAITLLLACITWWATPMPLAAQSATSGPPARLDLHGSVGWAHEQQPDLSSYDNWDHAVTHGAVGVGWYWSDHLKTELELTGQTSAQFYTYERAELEGHVAYQASRFTVHASSVAVAQMFQFLRNAWVHPLVGVGADMRRADVDERLDPITVYDSTSRGVRELAPGRVESHTSFTVRPFVIAGAKIYFSERAFVRTDIRASVGRSARNVVARVGIGIDF